MEAQTMVRFRWFWAWQDDKEEAWLASMSRQGWHLAEVSFLTYGFEKGAPRDYVYHLDYRVDKDLAEYVEFIQSTGWEYVGKMSGWQYFRLPAEGSQAVEFYTDPESKIEKHKRLLRALIVASPLWMVVFLGHLDRYPTWFAILFITLFLALIASYAVALAKLWGRIRQLEQL